MMTKTHVVYEFIIVNFCRYACYDFKTKKYRTINSSYYLKFYFAQRCKNQKAILFFV